MIAMAFLPLSMMAQIEVNDSLELFDDESGVEVINEDEEIQEGFDFPEALTDASLDSLMNLYMSKTYLSTDADCQMLSENPSFEKEVYVDRLLRMPTVMRCRTTMWYARASIAIWCVCAGR